jgi:hypothetical protein
MNIKAISKFKKLAVYSMLLTTVSLGFTACSDDEETVTPLPTNTTAKVLVTHASPNAPGVDLLVDNTKVNTAALEFLGSTAYLTVNAGTRNIKVNAAGTTTSVINANVPFVAGKNYSLFAVDSLSKISAVLVEDDLTAPASGKAHVRFIHLSPNAPAVDVALTGGNVVWGNYEFKEGSAFAPLDAGTYNLEVRLAGTTTVVLPLPGITLTAGKIYTVYAKGFVGGSGAQALGAQIIVNN